MINPVFKDRLICRKNFKRFRYSNEYVINGIYVGKGETFKQFTIWEVLEVETQKTFLVKKQTINRLVKENYLYLS